MLRAMPNAQPQPSSISPVAVVAHVIPLALALVYLIGAFQAARHDGVTAALWVSLLIVGVMLPVLAYLSLYQRSRAAWAFLVSICGVFAVVTFFGAPKVRDALHIGLGITMLLPALNVLATSLLVTLRGDYVDRMADAREA
jgi:hypothetical protein